jgi:hypothetical protein
MVSQNGYWMGCGVACVATLLECSFETALRLFESNPEVTWGNPINRGYRRREILAVLRAAGKLYRLSTVRGKRPKGYPPKTIIYCHGKQTRAGRELGHYLVRMEGGWMDPDGGWHRRRLGRLRVRSALVPAN